VTGSRKSSECAYLERFFRFDAGLLADFFDAGFPARPFGAGLGCRVEAVLNLIPGAVRFAVRPLDVPNVTCRLLPLIENCGALPATALPVNWLAVDDAKFGAVRTV
jgi:hypothetical protein